MQPSVRALDRWEFTSPVRFKIVCGFIMQSPHHHHHAHSPLSAAQSATGHPLIQPMRPECPGHQVLLPWTFPDVRQGRPRSRRRGDSEKWSLSSGRMEARTISAIPLIK